MPKSNLPAQTRFHKLVDDISRLYVETRKFQIKFAWETGRRIVQEEQNGAIRAQYGSALLNELSNVLAKELGPGFSVNALRKMRQFYLLNRIQPPAVELDWTDHVELLPIKDEKKRKELERLIVKENLDSKELRQLVHRLREDERPVKAVEKKPLKQELLAPKRGQLHTYKLVQRPTLGMDSKDRTLLLDLGFGNFHDIDARTGARFAPGTLVESRPSRSLRSGMTSPLSVKGLSVVRKGLSREDAYAFNESGRTEKDLYTYEAYIEKVVDGDTLKVRIDLGFELWTRQYLRLRGIDCPEMSTKSGEAAKIFVQSNLKEASLIIIRSSRSDKYDRYLADIFIPNKDSEVFLNNLLLQEGYAVRFET